MLLLVVVGAVRFFGGDNKSSVDDTLYKSSVDDTLPNANEDVVDLTLWERLDRQQNERIANANRLGQDEQDISSSESEDL